MAAASDRVPDRRLKQLLRTITPAQEGDTALALSPMHSLQPQGIVTLDHDDLEDIPYPLSRDEALSFLENVLEIPDPEGLLECSRLEFLNTFIYNMNTKIPFSNIAHVSQPMNDKHCPTFEECKNAIFRCHGGHCFYKNIFSKALLDVLGYKTFHVGGNNPGEYLINNHVGTIVCDVTYPGSLHLAEPGTRRPLYQAIPLDFEEDSPVYKFHFMESKFFKRDNGMLLWCAHAPEETQPSKYVLESEGTFWKVQLMYRLHVKRSRAFFAETSQYKFGIPGLLPQIQQVAFLVGFKEEKMYHCVYQQNAAAGRNFGAVRIDYVDQSLTEVEMLPREEVLEFILENFPQFPRHMLQTAFDNVDYCGRLYSL